MQAPRPYPRPPEPNYRSLVCGVCVCVLAYPCLVCHTEMHMQPFQQEFLKCGKRKPQTEWCHRLTGLRLWASYVTLSKSGNIQLQRRGQVTVPQSGIKRMGIGSGSGCWMGSPRIRGWNDGQYTTCWWKCGLARADVQETWFKTFLFIVFLSLNS